MTPERKKILTKISFAINGLVFLLSGIEVLEDSKITLCMLLFAASLVNFLMIPAFRRNKTTGIIGLAVFVMNIVAAISMAIDYFVSGSRYIQYAWILIALLSALGFIIQLRKLRTPTEKPEPV